MSWLTVKIDEIFDVARGGSPRPIQEYITDDPEGINWIMIGDASDSSKYITKTKKKIKSSGLKKSRLVQPGDFLLTNSMSFGRPYIMQTTGCIHDGWLVLSPKSENIDTGYFYHLLGSNVVYRHFSSVAAGAVVKNLNIDLVKALQISFPPLTEQKRIAAILDKADSLCRKNQQAIQLADKFLRAVFLDMFGDPVTNPKGWELKLLGDISVRVTKGESPKWQGFNYESQGVRFVTSENVIWGKLDNRYKYISDAFNEKLFRSKLCEGDVLINLVGASVGRACLVTEDSLPANINQAVSVTTLKTEILLPEIALQQILLPSIQKSLLGNVVDVARANISLTNIRELELAVPPIDKQYEFIRVIEKIRSTIKKQQTTSDLHLFDSLSQKAFAGKL